ncbi:hypothetical protein A6F68_01309 [Tsuneonella dongtanensis]|uniref:Uncharacterized protein n=1 Tax=Tsuneonella dongtanensis TaxID=692370 RepID=A0A1B2ACF6_9SPHN|nr:hypothetical protein [Tsuneonella dongtanensis]ANY19826.1 hypothetical protein A6F68_01309 [Tsuneonella dongtanensis]
MITSDDEIDRIARGLIDCTLPKPEWTHRAHFAAALWLLAHPEVLAREGGMAPLIRRYNEATGVANTATGGYHETITLASLRGAAAVLAAHPGAPLGTVLDALMSGPLGDKRWPLVYWSEARLMSPEARLAWVEPDLAPLPWPE